MIKQLVNKVYFWVHNKTVKALPSSCEHNGYIIADPEDLVEIVKDSNIVPTKTLRKILINGIRRLEDEGQF
ncbi:hypothetical protein FMK81_13170 [Klebsiella oxytoca]|uniref:hypothetical protein n=1 Tax=Klebsiella oxytoca TaxID=571 RepID=UPI001CCAAF6E|nr:hypothetical protein [Klebsiella oxytoca]MBZ7262458.1 hypothetical protein [Klebsiella oxytoca]